MFFETCLSGSIGKVDIEGENKILAGAWFERKTSQTGHVGRGGSSLSWRTDDAANASENAVRKIGSSESWKVRRCFPQPAVGAPPRCRPTLRCSPRPHAAAPPTARRLSTRCHHRASRRYQTTAASSSRRLATPRPSPHHPLPPPPPSSIHQSRRNRSARPRPSSARARRRDRPLHPSVRRCRRSDSTSPSAAPTTMRSILRHSRARPDNDHRLPSPSRSTTIVATARARRATSSPTKAGRPRSGRSGYAHMPIPDWHCTYLSSSSSEIRRRLLRCI